MGSIEIKQEGNKGPYAYWVYRDQRKKKRRKYLGKVPDYYKKLHSKEGREWAKRERT